MRKVRLVCDGFGDVKKYEDLNDYFSQENELVQVEVTYPSEFSSYRKRLDIYVDYDQSIDYQEDDVSTLLTVTLGSEHLKQGKVKLQPIAYVYEEGVEYVDSPKQKWEVSTIEVEHSLNVGESTVNVDSTLGQQLQDQIDAIDVSNKMDLDGSNSNVDVMTFNATTVELLSAIGQVRFNQDLKCLEVKISDNVTIQVGKEQVIEATNKEAVQMGNLKAVYISGGLGSSAHMKFATTSDIDIATRTIGLTTEIVDVNNKGHLTVSGLVNESDTSSWNEGDILWLSTDGDLTNVEPTKPTPRISVGVVLRSHASEGIVLAGVRVINSLDQLSNVVITNPQDRDVLTYDSATQTWQNKDDLAIPKYNDIVFELTQSRIGVNLKPDYDYTNIGLLFPQNDTNEFITITAQMPHSWVEGSTVYPHIHINQSQNQQATFRIQYKWYNIGDTIPTSFTNYDLTTYLSTYTSGNIANAIGNPNRIDGTGKKISSFLKMKIFRTDNAYVGDILADQFDVHILVDGFGSETQLTKE